MGLYMMNNQMKNVFLLVIGVLILLNQKFIIDFLYEYNLRFLFVFILICYCIYKITMFPNQTKTNKEIDKGYIIKKENIIEICIYRKINSKLVISYIEEIKEVKKVEIVDLTHDLRIDIDKNIINCLRKYNYFDNVKIIIYK